MAFNYWSLPAFASGAWFLWSPHADIVSKGFGLGLEHGTHTLLGLALVGIGAYVAWSVEA